MSISRSLAVSASGLTAERLRMDTISDNLANVNTTKGADGQPYRRKRVLFRENSAGSDFQSTLEAVRGATPGGARPNGVVVAGIRPDESELKKVWDPGHPDAVNGYVMMPNVEPVQEMVDLITATRAYEAGVTAIGAAKTMQQKALEIGKG
jgi:flagellar basal-body rod protein FlgC